MPQTQLITLGEFGERARPLREELREAALVIGLGQVGLQAVARIHNMLGAMLTRRDIQNNVRLLAMARQRSMRDEMILPREERLILKQERVNWSDVPGRYASLGVAEWWPHSPRAREVLDDLTQVRAFSRLMLYENATLVSEALFKLVQWLQAAGTGRDLKLVKRIYVLGSLAEAEGSGMIFDVASRLRALARTEPIQIVGVFSLRADIPADSEHIAAMANVYASLREMDSYTSLPETFPSNLPVVGHSLPRTTPRRALDLILLADDANATTAEAPELLLAEGVTNWIASSLLPPESAADLPESIPYDTDRFMGYSVFGVSKLSLPARTAMDLAASGLAQAALNAAKASGGSSASWVTQTVTTTRSLLSSANALHTTDVSNKVREWTYDFSSAGLIRHLETRAARGESARMFDWVQFEWRRLERDMVSVRMSEQNSDHTVPDTLRTRVDSAFTAQMRSLFTTLQTSPVDLAFAKGLGLLWVISAFEELEQQYKAGVLEHQHEVSEAQAAYQLARQELFDAAQQYDARAGGRGKKAGSASSELDLKGQAALDATTRLILCQAEMDVWQMLIELVNDLRSQAREVLPQIEPALRTIRELEANSRQLLEELARQTPHYPSAVLLTPDWYQNGTRDIAGFAQGQPRDLLSKVYSAWAPGELPPERWLSRFIYEVLDASRRALAGAFRFGDLYEALRQYATTPMFTQVMGQLLGTANPALLPMVDDKHAAPVPFEIVREVSRTFTVVPPASKSVRRSTVPSPDPDEISVMRMLHGIMAEALPPLRESYHRAYDRAGAEGMSLHIDRRWDSTMADLVHTSARREISTIWENLLTSLHNPQTLQAPLEGLIRSFGVALNVESTQIAGFDLPPDLRLVVYKLRPFRLKLPPPHCAVLFLYSNRTAAELGEEIFRAITPLPLEEQFAFVVNINGRTDVDQIVEPLRRVDYTVLTLNEADVKHLISARLPTRALSDMILHKVSLTTVSPFFTRGPVPDHMFFGREREINEVRSKLRTHSVALIGGRRIGKTSTLQRLERQMRPDESEYLPYYLDCHGATNYRSFFWLLNRRWNVDIDQDADPVQFEEVILQLQRRHPRKSIVILFDEVDSLLVFDRKPENMETLFRTLRSLSNEKRCQYIFSGEKWLMRAIANSQSAFFNFVQAVRLEPLPPKVVHHLVADPLEMLNIWMEDSDRIIDRIYKISAGHPNIVQMICQAMVEELDRNSQNANLLTYAQLDQATARRALQEEIVLTIWGQMNPLARLITLLWPEGERLLTLKDLTKMLRKAGIDNIPPDRLESTATDLELYCFVRRQGGDSLELIPMAFPAILDFMTDKRRQIEIVLRQYSTDPEGVGVVG